MPKEEWGVKRVCPTTGKRFYDLNQTPVISPYTGEVVDVETGKSRMIAADAEDSQTRKARGADNDDDLILDDEDVDVDMDDELLDEDEDEDNVSLDDIADVSGPDDE